jgi:recombination protein RecA
MHLLTAPPCPPGLQITDELVRSGAVDLVVVDSVAALVPRAELEGEMGMLQVGLQARLMSQGLRKLTGNASRSSATIIFLNQIRHKVGVGRKASAGMWVLRMHASLHESACVA